MKIPEVTIVTTGLIAGENVLKDVDWTEEGFVDEDQEIVIRRIGYVGSAALHDHHSKLYLGEKFAGLYYPTTVGVVVPLEDRDMKEFKHPKGVPKVSWKNVKMLANEAPTTNQVALTIDYREV